MYIVPQWNKDKKEIHVQKHLLSEKLWHRPYVLANIVKLEKQ